MSKSTKIFVISLCLLLLVGVLFRIAVGLLSKPSSPVTNFDDSTTNFRRVRYVGDSLIQPATLSQIQATITLPALEPFLDVALQKTGLTQSKYNPNSYSSSTEVVRINTAEHRLTYATYHIPEQSEDESTPPVGIDPKTAEEAALQAVTGMFGVPSDSLSLSSMYFLEADESGTYVESEDALIAIVLLNYTIEGIPLITNFEGNSTARVVLNSEYEPSVIELRPVQANVSNSIPFPTLSPDEAVTQINRNNGFIGNVLGQESRPVDLSTITGATLTTATIEYFTTRTDGSEQFLIPHYRFIGTGTNAEGQEFAIEILTPAINMSQQVE